MANTSSQQPTVNVSFLKNLKWWQATIMIVSILLAAALASYCGVNVSVNLSLQTEVSAIEKQLNIPINSTLSAFLKSNTYMVSIVDNYACLMNGSNAQLIEYLTNDTQVIDDALNNASVTGGSVYVAVGSYNAPGIVVPNDTRFIIETGATGITYTIAPGATCLLEDFNSWYFAYYQAGSIYSLFNYASWQLLTVTENMTTLYVSTISGLSGSSVQILGLTVQNGTSFPSSPAAGLLLYRSDLNILYYYNSTGWVACSGGGGGSSGGPYLLVSSSLNFLFQNGTRPLTSDWNVSAGLYGVTYINATTIYATTINQLTSGTGVQILNLVIQSGTTFPASPINQEEFFRTDQGLLYVYNNSWLPVGYTPSSYPYANLTGVPVLLLANGGQTLTGNWNIGGSYGIYGATWVNSTSISLSGQLWYNGQNETDVIANPKAPYSYEIYTDGVNTYMKNGTTGQIDYYNTNTSKVLQFALNNLTSGGKIYIKTGLYNISSEVIVQYSNITIEGDGASSHLEVVANFTAPALKQSIFYVIANNVIIEDLQLDGNQYNQQFANDEYGIWTNAVNRTITFSTTTAASSNGSFVVDTSRLEPSGYWVGYYLLITSGAYSGYEEPITAWNETSGTFTVSPQFGSSGVASGTTYELGSTSVWNHTQQVSILDNYIHDFGEGGGQNGLGGGVVFQFSDLGVMDANTLANCGHWGLAFWGDDNQTSVVGNSIINCYEGLEIHSVMNSYMQDYGSYENVISGNAVYNCTKHGIIADGSWNTLITANTVKDCGFKGSFDGNGGTGIRIIGQNIDVFGNSVFDSYESGIEVTGSNNKISDNYVEGSSQVTSKLWEQIGVNGTAANTVISDNTVVNNPVRSTIAKYGIWVRAGAGTGTIIEGNDVYGSGANATAGIECDVTNVTVINNPGYNPKGYIANPIAATTYSIIDMGGTNSTWVSATTYTNFQSPKTLYLSGGTITALIVDGQTLFTTAGSYAIVLELGDTFSVTFSAAPTITVIGQ